MDHLHICGKTTDFVAVLSVVKWLQEIKTVVMCLSLRMTPCDQLVRICTSLTPVPVCYNIIPDNDRMKPRIRKSIGPLVKHRFRCICTWKVLCKQRNRSTSFVPSSKSTWGVQVLHLLITKKGGAISTHKLPFVLPSWAINSRNSCISAIFCKGWSFAERLEDMVESKPAQSCVNTIKTTAVSGVEISCTIAVVGRCAHGQSLFCLQLHADEAYGSIQWKMTH